MKISKIIEELIGLKEIIGDKELEACIANAATSGVNIMYQNDDGGITSTSLEGEKAKADKLFSCLKCLVMRDLIKDCPEKKVASEIVKEYDFFVKE